jgi:hypothetical protein
MCVNRSFFFITYFPQLHFQCYPKSPPYPPPHFPTHSFPFFFWPWRSPVLGHIQFACPMGLSFQWWPTRPSFDTYHYALFWVTSWDPGHPALFPLNENTFQSTHAVCITCPPVTTQCVLLRVLVKGLQCVLKSLLLPSIMAPNSRSSVMATLL